MAKRTTKKKFDLAKVQTKFRIWIPIGERRKAIFGEPILIHEEKQMKYVDVPAHADLRQYVGDLRPGWTMTDDFAEIEEDEEVIDTKGK